jgi:hypothetical protein
MRDTIAFMRPKKAPTKQLRFREELAKKLEFIGLHRSQDIPDLTDAMFRVQIEREFTKTLERLNSEQKRAAGE